MNQPNKTEEWEGRFDSLLIQLIGKMNARATTEHAWMATSLTEKANIDYEKLKDFIRQQIAAAEERGRKEREFELDSFQQAVNELRSELAAARTEGAKEENNAWMSGKRCHECGGEMEPDPLSDTCPQCLENN